MVKVVFPSRDVKSLSPLEELPCNISAKLLASNILPPRGGKYLLRRYLRKIKLGWGLTENCFTCCWSKKTILFCPFVTFPYSLGGRFYSQNRKTSCDCVPTGPHLPCYLLHHRPVMAHRMTSVRKKDWTSPDCHFIPCCVLVAKRLWSQDSHWRDTLAGSFTGYVGGDNSPDRLFTNHKTLVSAVSGNEATSETWMPRWIQVLDRPRTLIVASLSRVTVLYFSSDCMNPSRPRSGLGQI